LFILNISGIFFVHLNIYQGDIEENVSGCFFLNTVYSVTVRRHDIGGVTYLYHITVAAQKYNLIKLQVLYVRCCDALYVWLSYYCL